MGFIFLIRNNMSYLVQSFGHMAAVTQMISESAGGMLFVYPAVFVIVARQMIGWKKRKLMLIWHLPGLILASIVHVYALIIVAAIQDIFDYFPHKAVILMPALYYIAAGLSALAMQIVLAMLFSKKKEMINDWRLSTTSGSIRPDTSSHAVADSHSKLEPDTGKKENEMSKLQRLSHWYSTRSRRQRNILRLVAFLLAAAPFLGWFFIAPWMVPLMLYLEYKLKPDEA